MTKKSKISELISAPRSTHDQIADAFFEEWGLGDIKELVFMLMYKNHELRDQVANWPLTQEGVD